MQFNCYIWDLYRNSPEGQAAIQRDVTEHWCILDNSGDIRQETGFTSEVFGFENVENGESDILAVNLKDLLHEFTEDILINDSKEADELFIEMIDDGWEIPVNVGEENQWVILIGGGLEDDAVYRQVFTTITGLSAGLHAAHSEYFIPYFFIKRFDHLTKICHFFSITLPDAPTKQQKRERALYYLEINRVLQAFRHEHGLSPEELNAFLYDFAPRNVKLTNTNTLPEASRVWFSIGNTVDFQYLDEANEESISFWQGNLEARRGDIVLMWCASPRSYLHSIWRVVDDGFNDPFFYYYNSIRVGHPLKIPPIPFKTFVQDPFLSTSPAVKAHFQGRSGSALSLEEYQAICGLIRQAGFDTTLLPTAPSELTLGDLTLNNERDVETQLLEPLLLKLGFTATDWVRQLPVRMGRGQRNYPDYVLGCDLKPGEESAISVLECKFRISSPKELKDAFLQAKSYALRLQAQSLTLADARGIWIFQQRSDGFVFDAFTFKVWKELTHPDILHEISLIFGKKVIDDAVQSRLRIMKAPSKPKG
jgi:hypothetical protein